MWPVSKVIWICIVTLGVCQYAQAASLRCYKGNLTSYITASLDDPLKLRKLSCFNPSLPTVFYTFGYRGRVDGPATTAVISAYLATKKRNVILLDWENEAASSWYGMQVGYVLNAVPNAKTVGVELGRALVKLAQDGLNMNQVHLMGHSLGAHLMGYAGQEAREKGYTVFRITGLDPASYLFEGFFRFLNLSGSRGLNHKCAKFVDVIHSSPGQYGISKPIGTVDVWPNYAGNGVVQPGCPEGSFPMFSQEDLCSHDRSWRYFVEALSAPTSFMATSADSFESWAARDINGSDTIYLGELTSKRARGNYYLTTNPKAPYGKGQDGIMPDSNQIRRRRRASVLDRLFRFIR